VITAAVDPAARKRLEAASTSYKLALNSIYGKLKIKSPYSSLFDSQCQIAVALTGQLLLINLIEQLQAAGCGVVSANTDGLFLRSPRGDERWQGVLEQWQSRTGLRLEREPLQRLVILAK
jgi:DNA polymerase elongation subunit (family B)